MQKHAVLLFLLLPLCGFAEPYISPPALKYLEMLRRHPAPGTVFERFYSSWIEEKTPAELLEFLSARAVKKDATATDHLILAVFQLHRGEDREALSSFTQALQLDGRNAEAWFERARIEARMLDFPAALISLEQAAAAFPAQSLTLDMTKLKGRVLLRLGRNEEALAIWHDIVKKHANDEDLMEEVIDMFADESQFEAALENSQALIKKTRDPLARTLRQLRMSDILLQADRRDEAIAMLDTVLAATGAGTWIEEDVLGRIERLFRMTDDVAGLEKHLAGLMGANPHRVNLAWRQMLLLADTGQSGVALENARVLLNASPGRRDLQDQFLDLLESLKQPRQAVEQAQMLYRQNPADKELLFRLATLQQRAGSHAEALNNLETYLTAAGADETAQTRVARLLESWEESAKKDSPASKAYQRLARTFPESLSAQEAYAHYLHRHGRREEALVIWRRLAETAALEDLLRIAQALQARLESRPALDLLISRDVHFGREPRFLALLVQTAIANKEYELALPWALRRLRLMRETDGIDDAMGQLQIILKHEPAKLANPLMTELQKQPSPSIQDRCLLSMLLNEDGSADAAAQMLKDAPAEDTLVALVQLTRLQQANEDWTKAAQTLQKVITLPDARTPARLRQLVDFLRRSGQAEQALQQITVWKMLNPSAVEPWLIKARVLDELYRKADSIKVLRQTVQKFPDASEAAHSYASACLDSGDAAEAERIYQALYERTTETEEKLRLLPPLTQASQQHGTLNQLVENFKHRQQQNRASAFPWMALAEIHRASANTPEHLRCLYEASHLRPQDLGLLLVIAHHEEKEGLHPEAIHTLEAAAKLDKTTRTKESLARLQIENGDPDAGYRILHELSGGDSISPAATEQIADAMALRGDWKHIVTLLRPILEKHPRNYRLHYMYGVAQEESEHEKEALTTFLRMMDMHEEMPGIAPAPAVNNSRPLPPGTEDWLRFAAVAGDAYGYQQRGRDLRKIWSQRASLQTASSLVPLPPDVIQSPAYALSHVLRIIRDWPEDAQQPILQQLQRLGVVQGALLVEAERNATGFAITPELLAAHPADAALHAAWLLSSEETQAMPALERCFELLQHPHPDLAIIAVNQLLEKSSASDSEIWFKRLIKLCSALPASNHSEWEVLLHLLLSQSYELLPTPEDPSIVLSAEEKDEIIAILRRWLRGETRPEIYAQITSVLIASSHWDAVLEGFQRMIELAEKSARSPQPAPSPQNMPHGPWDTAAPLPLTATKFNLPPDFARMLEPVLESLYLSAADYDETNILGLLYRQASRDQDNQSVKKFQAAMRDRIQVAQNPRLQLLLRLLCGDAKLLLAEKKSHLSKPEAAFQDLLTAGWLHQLLGEHQEALELFLDAARRTPDQHLLEQIDSACLFQAISLRREGDSAAASAAVRLLLDRLLKKAVTTEEKREVAHFLESFDLADEAEKLLLSLPEIQPAAQPLVSSSNQNPYSRLLALGKRGGTQDLLDRLLLQNNATGALAQASRRVHQLAVLWVSPHPPSEITTELTTLLLKLGMHDLRQSFFQTLKTTVPGGWEALQDYATVLEMQHVHGRVFQNNDGDRSLSSEELRSHAIQEYESVIAANPQAHGARRRLVMLLALNDATGALKHWTLLPETLQPGLLFPLTDKVCAEQKSEEVTAITRLITSWLKQLDPARPLPYQTKNHLSLILKQIERSEDWPCLQEVFGPGRPGNGVHVWEFDNHGLLQIGETLRRQRNDRRVAFNALCRTMTRFPELAEMGFAPLAGLAIFENRDLSDMEQLALQVLSLRSSQPAVRRNTIPRPPPAEDNRLFESDCLVANPASAFFATWSAVQRRDLDMLENAVYPAILKADGQPMLDFCRGYAEMMLADDNAFTAAATAWVHRWIPAKWQYAEAFHSGGMVYEIVRLWKLRRTAAPLDELFLPYRELSIIPSDPMDNTPVVLATTPYIDALLQREPAELRRFIHLVREVWISPDANVRRQAMARFQENEKIDKSYRNTRIERRAGIYLAWLKELIRTKGSPVFSEAAEEEGALNAKE